MGKPSTPGGKSKIDNNDAVKRCRIRKNKMFLQAQNDEKYLMQEIQKRRKNIELILKRFESHMATLPLSISNNPNVQRIYQKFTQMSKPNSINKKKNS
jgi:nicotinamide mononucleotide adenylyltransferase